MDALAVHTYTLQFYLLVLSHYPDTGKILKIVFASLESGNMDSVDIEPVVSEEISVS